MTTPDASPGVHCEHGNPLSLPCAHCSLGLTSANEAARLRARVSELEALVQSAYFEGLVDGRNEARDDMSHETVWRQSAARRALGGDRRELD